MGLGKDPVGFLSGLVASMYAEAAAQEQVPGGCGLTPLEHFILGEDGVYRLQSDHIHVGPPVTAHYLAAGTITGTHLAVR